MLIKRYIDLKYEMDFKNHMRNCCNCNLKEGENGLCNYGRYLEGLDTPQDFLKDIEDKFYNIKYGTFIRTDLDDIARIIGVDKINIKTYFILDKEVDVYTGREFIKTNKIGLYDIENHSNDLKDLVKIGDIVNGYRIIKIDGDKLYYGYWGDRHISGEIEEVLSKKYYLRDTVINMK